MYCTAEGKGDSGAWVRYQKHDGICKYVAAESWQVRQNNGSLLGSAKAINLSLGCDYFLPGPWLSCQL